MQQNSREVVQAGRGRGQAGGSSSIGVPKCTRWKEDGKKLAMSHKWEDLVHPSFPGSFRRPQRATSVLGIVLM
jgi:hypothetical protein